MNKVEIVNNFLSAIKERAIQVGGKGGGQEYIVGYVGSVMRQIDIKEDDLKQIENDTRFLLKIMAMDDDVVMKLKEAVK